MRLMIFLRDHYTCQAASCGFIGDESQLVCDHKRPHRGDETLFWDQGNLQTLCKSCHVGMKQREEQVSLHERGVWY
jgi:5-methylcytosine-specific restriction endonuclease McrA